MVRSLSIANVILAAAAPALAAAPAEFNYLKRDTRQATRDATLAQYMPVLSWGEWYLIGPFDNTGKSRHDVVYQPELEVDLDRAVPGKGGGAVAWQRLDHAGWDPIDLRRFGGGPDDLAANEDSIAYLYRRVTSDSDGTATFQMGSDDGLKLWLNGRLLVDADAYRGLNVTDHRVDLPIVEGTNTLLVKVTQGVAAWQFQMRPLLDPQILARLDYRLDQDFPTSPEARHYRILTVLDPPEVVLEVGGLDVLPDGRPVVATRRGDVWVVDGAYDDPPFNPTFTRFASGLHEPLGLRWHDGALEAVQRAELTALTDEDGDGAADLFRTVSDQWGISGNYHEFAFGPEFDGQGRRWVTLNLGFCGSLGKSIVPWRGWAVIVKDDGTVVPVCGGLRSPNGLGRNAAGDMFFTDNQGDWVGTCKLAQLDFGDWHGHPGGDGWYSMAGYDPPRGEQDFKRPAVWFPYGRMGQSASDILLDDTGGAFGPFTDQLFVGDQTNATVMRVYLERVGSDYQGACFPFRGGFDCGVNRMCFGPDGSMFVGLTNRGWGSLGRRSWGLQRVVYTGVRPFEVLRMNATPEGFTLTFTEPVDPAAAGRPSAYGMSSFTYHRHEKYGSPEIDRRELVIRRVEVSPDGLAVRLDVDGLREGYVHELHMPGMRSAAGDPLLHEEAYYTLNVIPGVRGQGSGVRQ